MIKAYLVDDEPPAIDRLSRMLKATGRVEILGSSIDPVDALNALSGLQPDVIFLDIHMPGLSGFDLLTELCDPPLVVFTTAYEKYALEAFRANSIDYLVKPIESEQLERALAKADRFIQGARASDVGAFLAQIASTLHAGSHTPWLTYLASRSGQKVNVIDVRHVTHLFAEDKLTCAATPEHTYIIDRTIAELDEKLDPARFFRIHRGAILNLDYLAELHAGLGGRLIVRLKDRRKTELAVSRTRARSLRQKLGL